MNLLTFDIEEWYIEKMFFGGRKEKYYEFNNVLNKILDILDEENFAATFFCLGQMSIDFPEVIKLIDSRGHEIACHSDKHSWLNKLSESDVYEDTRGAIDSIEQCTGKKVLSYRAPAFSVGENNPWVFEILAKCGIERDASVFPAARDFGGFESFSENIPSIINYNGINIKEFPVSTIQLFGNQVAYSGGGYFRLFPLSFIKKQFNSHPYTMTYFHIWDLIPETKKLMSKDEYEKYFKESGNLFNRYKRFIKGNLGTKNAYEKLLNLLKSNEFCSLEIANQIIDWEKVPKVTLNKK